MAALILHKWHNKPCRHLTYIDVESMINLIHTDVLISHFLAACLSLLEMNTLVDCYYKTYILQLRELEVDSQLQLELHSSTHQCHGEQEHLADTFDGGG
jgi:hypothetical protein